VALLGLTAASVALAQWIVFDDWGGYGGTLLRLSSAAGTPMAMFHWNPLPGFLGFLFSPNRGAILFWPLFFCGMPYGAAHFRRTLLPHIRRAKGFSTREWTLETAILVGAAAYFVQLCFVDFWFAEWSFGPRYLYELSVAIALATAWCAQHAGRLGKAAIGFALVWSIGIHGAGALLFDPYVWHSASATATRERLWNFDDLLIADTFEAGLVTQRPNQKRALDRLKRLGY
jgi:hypothetical protein